MSRMLDTGHGRRDLDGVSSRRDAPDCAAPVARQGAPNTAPRSESLLPEASSRDGVIDRAFNVCVALVLLIASAPVFAVVSLVILAVDGRPVFHAGRRFGRHKKPFTMLKFRTLINGASSVIGPEILSQPHSFAIPVFGNFLRDTRLDELPQLLNVIRGDMRLLGPRPVRPEVYDRLCRGIAGYDRRFEVTPGLIGVSQLFTPHCAPKRLRSALDRRVVGRSSPLRDLYFVGCTAVFVARAMIERTCSYLRLLAVRGLGSRTERRRLGRKVPPAARVRLTPATNDGLALRRDGGAEKPADTPIVDINEDALKLVTADPVPHSGPLEIAIDVRFRRRFRSSSGRVRSARCTGEVIRVERVVGCWMYVVRYTPVSQSSRYVIAQYLLERSLARPFVRCRRVR